MKNIFVRMLRRWQTDIHFTITELQDGYVVKDIFCPDMDSVIELLKTKMEDL